ncbi:MAG: glycogen/starch synthase, partial [Candidatus Heimdallarchaeota archaeon]|nr:glycogen/starch synthase [Candidatus Heimdallarchaeota archaeon]
MSRILYICSEAFPLIKTGGLADVAGSLPAALLKQSQDVRLLLPAYASILQNISKRKVLAETSYYDLPVKIIKTRLPGTNVIVWLVDCPAVFNRPGGPYTDHHGQPWHDNA